MPVDVSPGSPPPLSALTRANSLGALLLEREKSERDDVRFLHTPGTKGVTRAEDDGSISLSYAALTDASRRAAFELLRQGVGAGDRVALLLPTGVDFLTAFFGAQLIGAVPVPLVPPWSIERFETHLARLRSVIQRCEPKLTVTSTPVLNFIQTLAQGDVVGSLFRAVIPSEELAAQPASFDGEVPNDPEQTAFLQFTSGSTSEPKGVELSHRNVLANAHGIGGVYRFDVGDPTAVSWLPLFHDMGLIGHVLVPLLWNRRTILMPPEVFMRQPRTWLEAISKYRATVSTAPNFAYDLCATRIKDRDVDALDLSHWRVAMCGAEPILEDTLTRFCTRFARAGFRRETLVPVYGLAESTLAVSLSPFGRGAKIDVIDREDFARTGHATPAGEQATDEQVTIVGVGFPLPGHAIRIVDDSGTTCADRVEGNVTVRGDSVMRGYYQDAVATSRCLTEGWLLTGDRGYLVEGELFITGRARELIIRAGQNLYPYDVEAAACVPGVRAGRVAAFGVTNQDTGTEDLVLLCETKRPAREYAELERQVLAAVTGAVGVKPDHIVFLAPGVLSKTSSGKLQRALAKAQYLEGALQAPRVRLGTWAKLLIARARFRGGQDSNS